MYLIHFVTIYIISLILVVCYSEENENLHFERIRSENLIFQSDEKILQNDFYNLESSGSEIISNNNELLFNNSHIKETRSYYNVTNQQNNFLSSNESNFIFEDISNVNKNKTIKELTHLYVQVLVGVDETVVKFHGESVIEQYVLTQMSIVNDIYQHESLGSDVKVIVSKIIFIKSKEYRILVANDARSTLERFCDWANRHRHQTSNYNEASFDLALYLTRDSFGPAGYASVTGMCVPERSCAIVRDDGTSSAFVIAHEIGHVFGMIHDGFGNDCSSDASDGRIMASMVQSNYHLYFWSKCSQDVIKKNMADYQCLLDKPMNQLRPKYSQPFGQSWSLDEQCRQEFGAEFNLCRAFDGTDPCKLLWCGIGSNSTVCKTKRGPPLSGTACDRGKWCMDGQCKERSSISIDGNWSSWSSWTQCSKTCHYGVHYRARICSNPKPSYGGKECLGNDEEFKLCNTEPCSDKKDARLEQCSVYNNKRFDGNRRHQWIPAINNNKNETCKLSCISKDFGISFITESNVIDGTFCSYEDEHNICIKGICKKIGCDGDVNSDVKINACGICGGDSKQCTKVGDSLIALLGMKEYHSLVKIPQDARNIVIKERSSRPHLAHFLAIRDMDTEEWILNGGANQSLTKSFVSHGTVFKYLSSKLESESIIAKGPITSAIEIFVYSQSSKISAAVDYEYLISANSNISSFLKNSKSSPAELNNTRYEWSLGGWSDCSKTCDTGFQVEKFVCIDKKKQQIANGFCIHQIKQEGRRECNLRPCPTSKIMTRTTNKSINKPANPYWWQVDEWSKCSISCGYGGFQSRHVSCVTKDPSGQIRAIEPAYCNPRMIPPYIRICEFVPC